MEKKVFFNEKYLLSGYGFKDHEPYFQLDTILEGRSRRLFHFIRNNTFTLTRYKSRYCIGRYNILTFIDEPCPKRHRLFDNQTICQDCKSAIDFNPAFYNVSSDKISDKQRKYNEQKHNVYLAYFGSENLKVGIAHHKRTFIRLLEQGARAAAVIQNCSDAYEARKIEAFIKRQFNISEALQTATKKKLLNLQYDFHDAKNRILDLVGEISISLHSINSSPNVHNFNYDYIGENSLDTDIIDVSKGTPLFISGKCIGMVGDIMVVEQFGRKFLVPIKLFISHIVKFKEDLVKHKTLPKQLSLF